MGGPYAPWWRTAIALAAITVAHWVLLRRLLGVSGILQRVAFYGETRALAKAEALAPRSAADLEAAMLAATAAEFSPEMLRAAGLEVPADPPPPAAAPAPGVAQPTLGACVAFLVAIAVGALASKALRGGFSLQLAPADAYVRVFGGEGRAWLALVAGGFLVGLGTSLCGGCSSGHGLSGCSRLQRGSLVATASFVGVAIVVSLLLAGRLP